MVSIPKCNKSLISAAPFPFGNVLLTSLWLWYTMFGCTTCDLWPHPGSDSWPVYSLTWTFCLHSFKIHHFVPDYSFAPPWKTFSPCQGYNIPKTHTSTFDVLWTVLNLVFYMHLFIQCWKTNLWIIKEGNCGSE